MSTITILNPDGIQTDFTYTHAYQETDDVIGYSDGLIIAVSHVQGDEFRFPTAPLEGSETLFFRLTDADELNHIFKNQAYIRADRLNSNFEQLLFLIQENTQAINDPISGPIGQVFVNKSVYTVNGAQPEMGNSLTRRDHMESVTNNPRELRGIEDEDFVTERYVNVRNAEQNLNTQRLFTGTQLAPQDFATEEYVAGGNAVQDANTQQIATGVRFTGTSNPW
jgi:hypothetical protein